MSDIDAEITTRRELLATAVGEAKAAEFGRVVSDRLAEELRHRQDLRDASHDVSSGKDWARHASNWVPRDELERRRAEPGPLTRDTAAAVERAAKAVADLPAPRGSPDVERREQLSRWADDDRAHAHAPADTLER